MDKETSFPDLRVPESVFEKLSGLQGVNLENGLCMIADLRRRQKESNSWWVSVDSEIYKYLYGDGYRALIDFIKILGMVEENPSYFANKKSGFTKQYKLKFKYRNGPLREFKVRKTLSKKLTREAIRDHRTRRIIKRDQRYAYVHSWLSRLTVDDDIHDALRELDFKEKTQKAQTGYIDQLQAGKPVFSYKAETGRLTHSLCLLARDLRPFLCLDGEVLYEVDIHACHPLILASMVPRNNGTRQSYLDLFKDGDFYINLYRELGIPAPETKKERQKIANREIFNAKYFPATHKVWTRFEAKFPDVAKTLRDLHSRTGAKQWMELQSLEADSVFKAIERLMVDEVPCISLHDAIITTQQHVMEVRDVMVDSFHAVTGLKPDIGCKAYRKREHQGTPRWFTGRATRGFQTPWNPNPLVPKSGAF